MREIRPSGLEGGVGASPSLPLYELADIRVPNSSRSASERGIHQKNAGTGGRKPIPSLFKSLFLSGVEYAFQFEPGAGAQGRGEVGKAAKRRFYFGVARGHARGI